MHTVYKYVYNSEIIYVGKSDGYLPKRLGCHGRKGDNIPESAFREINDSDIYYAVLPNRIMSDVVESELIRRYKPIYNKAKKSEWDGLMFTEPIWKPYRVKSKGTEECQDVIMKSQKSNNGISEMFERNSGTSDSNVEAKWD